MDEAVIRSMARWPDVPDVYGWLALDRRGNWLVKGAGGVFGRIANAALNDFISRNYRHDDAGRWFFQNGPQRVFVNLHHMPLVYRLEQLAGRLSAHTGASARCVHALWLDDAGAMIVETDLGAGVLDDRDLAQAVELIRDEREQPPGEEALLALAAGEVGTPLYATFDGCRVAIAAIASATLAGRFAFNPAPRPPAGQPDC